MSATAETVVGPARVGGERAALVGRVLDGKYRLDAELGSGGMGIVLRGQHLVTGRAIAVKILRVERGDDPDVARRFLREARIAAVLDHPNVVGVLDCGETDDGLAYQVLDLLEGESLRDRLSRGRLSVARTLELLLPILHALEIAHAADVIHRDLKPANIFLARNKHGRIVPKLLDFGIAKVRGSARQAVSKGGVLTPTTQAGMLIGTPAYMSPEQARAEGVSKASDLYSVASVLFECVTGQIPFDGMNPNVIMARIVLEEAPRADTVEPSVPRGIADAIAHAHRRAPEERPVGAAALASELRAAAREAGVALPAEGSADCADDDPETSTTLVHVPKKSASDGADVAPVTPAAAARVVSSSGRPPAPDPRPSPWIWAAVIVFVVIALGLALALGGGASTRRVQTPAALPVSPDLPSAGASDSDDDEEDEEDEDGEDEASDDDGLEGADDGEAGEGTAVDDEGDEGDEEDEDDTAEGARVGSRRPRSQTVEATRASDDPSASAAPAPTPPAPTPPAPQDERDGLPEIREW